MTTLQSETELAEAARAALRLFSYPDHNWVTPVFGSDGEAMLDVVIVGGGQSGLAAAHGLKRAGVNNIVVLDSHAAGEEGVWKTFARMSELRTPKGLFGLEQGLNALSLQHWFIGQYGYAAWEGLNRVPRLVWARYLRWFRETLDLPVENNVAVHNIIEGECGTDVKTIKDGAEKTYHARFVVLATGHDGAGQWTVPTFISETLPTSRYDHSNGPIDFAALKGRRIGVLGHGASAFDAAAAALEAGAVRVDLCFRRTKMPLVNPHRHIETAGMLLHFPDLPDATRWAVARHFQIHDQPPADSGFFAATAYPGFHMHAGSPWQHVEMASDVIKVTTPRAEFEFDHVIVATGYKVDLAARPELKTLAPLVARWKDRFTPPDDLECPMLGEFAYVDKHYEFMERDPSVAPWVNRVFAFNVSAYVSMCAHSTSISGHRYCVPRLLDGVTQRLMMEQADTLVAELEAYNNIDLDVPAHLRAAIAAE